MAFSVAVTLASSSRTSAPRSPGVLKTAGFGYDGKGQTIIRSPVDAPPTIDGDFVYEAFVDFDRELSVVAARGIDGSFEHWGIIENTHKNHILDLSVSPANVSSQLQDRAIEIARGVLEQLGVVGVLEDAADVLYEVADAQRPPAPRH